MSTAPHPLRAGRRFVGGLVAATFVLAAAAAEVSAAGDAFDAFAEAGGERLRPASTDELREALVGLAERRLAADGLHVDAARVRLTLSRPLRFDEPLEAVPLWRAGLQRRGQDCLHGLGVAVPSQREAQRQRPGP